MQSIEHTNQGPRLRETERSVLLPHAHTLWEIQKKITFLVPPPYLKSQLYCLPCLVVYISCYYRSIIYIVCKYIFHQNFIRILLPIYFMRGRLSLLKKDAVQNMPKHQTTQKYHSLSSFFLLASEVIILFSFTGMPTASSSVTTSLLQ